MGEHTNHDGQPAEALTYDTATPAQVTEARHHARRQLADLDATWTPARYARLRERLFGDHPQLLAHPACVVLPVEAGDAGPLVQLLQAGAADLARAATLLEAADRRGYVVTRNAGWYRLGDDPLPVDDLPVIVI